MIVFLYKGYATLKVIAFAIIWGYSEILILVFQEEKPSHFEVGSAFRAEGKQLLQLINDNEFSFDAFRRI